MSVDPEIDPSIEQRRQSSQPDYRNEDPQVIADMLRSHAHVVACEPSDVQIIDRTIPGPARDIPIRIYQPPGSGPFPVVVSYHGGGWVMGSLPMDDGRNLQLAEQSGCAIVSVDYCLSPEHRFPEPVEEAYAALIWVADNAASIGCDPASLAVAGGSAGGNLAAAVAIMARDRGGPALGFQLLFYPVCGPDFERGSYIKNGEGRGLTTEAMQWFWDQYVPSAADRENPYAAPDRAESLHGLPPALIIVAQYDPLRDEGEAYAARLREHGVAARSIRLAGLMHGFLSTDPYSARSRETIRTCAKALRSAFAR